LKEKKINQQSKERKEARREVITYTIKSLDKLTKDYSGRSYKQQKSRQRITHLKNILVERKRKRRKTVKKKKRKFGNKENLKNGNLMVQRERGKFQNNKKALVPLPHGEHEAKDKKSPNENREVVGNLFNKFKKDYPNFRRLN
jgi:hypothetical protein